MLEKIKDELDIELLKLFGIEIKDGNFIKTATGEKFVQYDVEKTKSNGIYTYRCGDTKIKVHTMYPSNPIPSDIIVTEDNISYYAYENRPIKNIEKDSYLRLTIKNQDNAEYQILIRPQMGENFIKTDIDSPYCTASVNCSFDNMITTDLSIYDFKGIRGIPFNFKEELGLENYEEFLKNVITIVFRRNPEIVNAFIKCMPILIKSYLKYADFPDKYHELHLNYYDTEEELCDRVFALKVHHELDAINSGKQPEKKDELAMKYISDSVKLRTVVTEAMKEKDKKMAVINKQRKDFETFLNRCCNKDNPAKKLTKKANK